MSHSMPDQFPAGGFDHPYYLYHERSGMAIQVGKSAVPIQVGKSAVRGSYPVIAAPFTGEPEQTWVSIKGTVGCWFINVANGNYLTAVRGDDGKVQIRAQVDPAPMEWFTPESTQDVKTHYAFNLIPVDITFVAGWKGLAWTNLDADGGKSLDVVNCTDNKDADWTPRGPKGPIDPTTPKDAPERAEIMSSVRTCLSELDAMVHILDNPAHGGDDLTDLIYDQPSIERFKSLSRECAANLEVGRRAASQWVDWTASWMMWSTLRLSSIDKQLKDAVNDAAAIKAHRMDKVAETRKHVQTLEVGLKNLQTLVDAAQDHWSDTVENNLQSAVAAREPLLRTITGTLPFPTLLQALRDGLRPVVTAETMAALDMARQKLNDDQQKYNDLRSDLDSMLKEVESPDNDVEEIVKLRVIHEQVMHELDTQAPRRMELSNQLKECLHAVSGASVSAGHAAEPTMMSLTLVAKNMKELRKQLMADEDKDFGGALMELDTALLESLGKRIKAMDSEDMM